MVKILRPLMRKTTGDVSANKTVSLEDGAMTIAIEEDRQKYVKLMGSFAGIADRKGRVIFATEAPVKELGYAEDEILGKPFWGAAWFSRSEQSQKAIKDGISGALSGHTTRCQVDAFTKEGINLPVTLSIGPLKGKDMDIIGIVAETEPIVLPSEAPSSPMERSATTSEDMMSLLELMQEAYFRADATNKITMVNYYAAKLLGYSSPQELVGKKMAEMWAKPDERDRYLMHLSRKSKVIKYAATFKKKDGAEILVEVDAHLFSDINGEVRGSEGAFRIHTAREDLETAKEKIASLEKSFGQYETIVDNLDEGVALLEEGAIRFANSRLAQILGYDAGDLAGKPFTIYLSPSSAEAVEQWFSEDESTSGEIDVITQEGGVDTFHMTLHKLDDEGISTWMMVLKDAVEEQVMPEAPPQQELEAATPLDIEDILEKLDCGAMIIVESDISFANDNIYEIVGCLPGDPKIAEDREQENFSLIKDFFGHETIDELLQRHKERDADDTSSWIMHLDVANSDNTQTALEVRGSPIKYEGEPAELLLVRAIPDDQLALEEIRKSEQYLKTVLSATGNAIFVIDPMTHKIVDANAKAVELTGLTQSQLLGQVCHSSICPEASGNCPITDLQQTMSSSQHILPKADGTEIPVLRTVTPATWHEHTYLIESLTDISQVRPNQVAETPVEEEEEEEYYPAASAAVEAAPDAILSISAQDEAITSANPAFAKFTGWEPDEWMGRSLHELVHAEDFQQLKEAIEESLQGETIYPMELRFLCSSGEYFTGEAVVASTADKEDTDTVFLFFRQPAYHEEEAEEVKEEEKPESEEGLFQELMEIVSEGIHIVEIDGTVKYESPSMQKMFSYEPKELLRKNIFDLVHPDDVSDVIDIFNHTVKYPDAMASLEFHFMDKDGSWHHIEANIKNLLQNTSVNGVVLSYRFIPEHTEIQEALPEDSSRFRSLIENAHEGIQIVNSMGTIQYASPANETIFGRKYSELVGQNAFTSIHPKDAPRIVNAFHHLMQNPGNAMSLECSFLHEDGSWRHVQASATSLIHDPAVEGIVISYYDITERRRIEAELQASQEKLNQTMAKLKMSHDEVSAPVVQIWDNVLALPLVGLIDSQRERKISDVLLTKIVDTRAQIVLLDASGVDPIDAKVIGHLVKTVQSSSLLGAECIITGLDPDVASEMEATVGKKRRFVNKANLQEGLAYALSRVGYDVSSR